MIDSDYTRALRVLIGPDLLLAPAVAALIQNHHGEALVTQNSGSRRIGMPEGPLRPGEAPAEAVVRVAMEETGLEVTPARVVGVVGGSAGFRSFDASGGKVEYTVIIFYCNAAGVDRDGETSRFRWAAPAELRELHPGYPPETFQVSGGPAIFQWDEAWLEALLRGEHEGTTI